MQRIANISLGGTNGPIRGRIMIKSNLGTYSDPEREMEQVLSGTIRDEDGSDIDFAAFGDNARNLHSFLKRYQDYEISNYGVKLADETEFSETSHPYSLVINDLSGVVHLNLNVQPYDYNIQPISNLDGSIIDSPVNILGVVVECEEAEPVRVHGFREEKVRGIHIADKSGYRIRVKLWAHNATEFVYNPENPPIVLVCKVKHGIYGDDYILKTGTSSMIIVNPRDEMNNEEFESIRDDVTALENWKQIGIPINQLRHCSPA